ncbi:acyl-CoA dehydrogenase family protein [Citricoccus sp. I39-566]|uniref:acyl-CoA dehydrogenase family protein n=1 Tax=Citricoccus sp. I39-566 TaxID=3073268 RepID=UPI00286AEFC6|nr:acyl-CoA dehydrogenase family protein [Citricoccus sp. I39-566]WMY78632.1 acyl-CoA dehydrogenase family protein [Citricoccus sp. I39-566]
MTASASLTHPVTGKSLATGTNLATDLPRDYEGLREYFQPLFDQIAAGAVERERERGLPSDVVRALDEAGFGTLRVPANHGGPGISLVDFFRLVMDLAEADSNVAHIYRSHYGFLESLRFQPRPIQEAWYSRVLAGATVGNASTEKGGNTLGTLNTTLTESGAGTAELNGTKFYATGSIYSDYTRVSAARVGPDGATQEGRQFAVVATDDAGVTLEDDWDGFGQKLTGTGTAVFSRVPVPAHAVLDRAPGSAEAVHEAAFFQLVLLAVLAGIARAARRDTVAVIRTRKRTFNTGSGLTFSEDPIIQEAAGRIAAKAFTAEATVLHAARALDAGIAAAEAVGADRTDFAGELPAELYGSELAVEHAMITVPELGIGAAQDLFLTVGASATSTSKALDRHWRNAQTVATHNPIAFRARSLGDYWINGTLPEGLNAIGDAKIAASATGGQR